jgi:hypothetical protein
MIYVYSPRVRLRYAATRQANGAGSEKRNDHVQPEWRCASNSVEAWKR